MRLMASAGKNTRSKFSSLLKRQTPRSQRYVLCVRNDGYPGSLQIRKFYKRLPDPEGEWHGLTRVIDESGRDYLYPREFFIPVILPKTAEIALPARSK